MSQSAAATTPAPSLTAPQGSHMWLVTLQLPTRDGMGVWTLNGTFTPGPGWTRMSAYDAIRDCITRDNPQLATANVLFLSIEPNTL